MVIHTNMLIELHVTQVIREEISHRHITIKVEHINRTSTFIAADLAAVGILGCTVLNQRTVSQFISNRTHNLLRFIPLFIFSQTFHFSVSFAATAYFKHNVSNVFNHRHIKNTLLTELDFKPIGSHRFW